MRFRVQTLTLGFTASLILFAGSLLAQQARSESSEVLLGLGELRWENRLIVLDDAQDQARTLSELRVAAAELDERHVLWFSLRGENVVSNHTGTIAPEFAQRTREQLNLAAGDVVLLGKDGGIKDRSPDLDMKRLMSLIDSMPMRAAEMRRSSRRQ